MKKIVCSPTWYDIIVILTNNNNQPLASFGIGLIKLRPGYHHALKSFVAKHYLPKNEKYS